MADAIVQSYLESFYRKHVFSGGTDGQMLVQDSNSATGAGWSSGPTLTDMTLGASGTLAWSTDLKLTRDAANTLAQRNSTNSQALRIYGTFTDASNYERLAVGYDSANTRYMLQVENGGTGSARNLNIGTNGSAELQLRTNGSTRWRCDANGHLLAATDNTYDIGASGATRPRTVYAGTSFVSGTFTLSAFGTLTASADGVFLMRNNAGTSFNRLQLGGTSASFPAMKANGANVEARLADDSARTGLLIAGLNFSSTIQTSAGTVLISNTAPTVNSGFGTSPVIAANGTAAFTVNVGTGGTASSGVITLPAATTGWIIQVNAPGQPAHFTRQTASTTTTATLTNYNSAGTLTAWPASTVLNCSAMAY